MRSPHWGPHSCVNHKGHEEEINAYINKCLMSQKEVYYKLERSAAVDHILEKKNSP